jgi:hypothetical protein
MNLKALAAASIFALAACSGGGGSDNAAPPSPPAPIANAEGLWSGTDSTSRSVTGIVFEDGTYWILYSIPHVAAVLGGVIQGTGTSLNGSFSSSSGVDFNVEGQGVNNATLSASYATRQTLNGSVAYPALNQTYTFTSAYDPAYEQTPAISAIAGTYSGISSVTGTNEVTSIVITAPGVIAGVGTGGCKFLGTVAPRSRGNAYDLSITFGGGACSSGTSKVTGIGYFDAVAKRFYVAALNSARTNGLLYLGLKL